MKVPSEEIYSKSTICDFMLVTVAVLFTVCEILSHIYVENALVTISHLMLQCCVRLSLSVRRRLSSVCNVCIVAKRCVLEQKLLLTAYRKS